MLAARVDQDRRGTHAVGIRQLAYVARRRDGRIEPRNFAANDLGIAVRLHAIRKRPQHRVHRIGIDVNIDRDEDLAERCIERGGRAQGLPGLTDRRAVELDHEEHVAARHLVRRDFGDARDVTRIAQMAQIDRVEGDLANHRAFTRRKLADDALVHRRTAVRDRRDFKDLLELARSEISARFAERRFGFQHVRANTAFDDDFGVSRHEQIRHLRFHQFDRRTVEGAGNPELIDAVGHFTRRCQDERRRSADKNCRIEMAAHAARLLPHDREVLRRYVGRAADAIDGFDHAAVDAEVVRARFRIARDPASAGDERRGIEAGRGDQMRKRIDAFA